MEYLVLDVGGSAIKYALMNDELEFLEKGQVPTPKTSLEDFKKEVQNLYQKYQERVDGIAMSLPGLINKKTNKIQIPGALLYNQDVDILKELKSVTTNRLTIENDAKCAALCEVVYGSLKDSQVGAVCIIGTGIGGGVTIGDKVFTGVHGFAGEFSYLSIDWKKNLGFENKWGTDFGAFTLVEMIAKAKGLEEKIDGVQAFEYCNQGDKEALKALDILSILVISKRSICKTSVPIVTAKPKEKDGRLFLNTKALKSAALKPHDIVDKLQASLVNSPPPQ